MGTNAKDEERNGRLKSGDKAYRGRLVRDDCMKGKIILTRSMTEERERSQK
jgi:hypothetical protein